MAQVVSTTLRLLQGLYEDAVYRETFLGAL